MAWSEKHFILVCDTMYTTAQLFQARQNTIWYISLFSVWKPQESEADKTS